MAPPRRVTRIVAFRHEHRGDDPPTTIRVYLPNPPTGTMTELEAIMAGWWQRSSGYPVGKRFATTVVPGYGEVRCSQAVSG